MRLYFFNVFSLGENFKKIIVGKEVEAGKDSSFSFKILLKTLLNFIKINI
jgi:hypothetical protein